MLQPLQDPLKRFFDQVVSEASYIIFQEAGKTYVKNCKTGQIEYSGEDASTVIQSVINQLQDGTIFIKRGRYRLKKPVTVKNNNGLIAENGTVFYQLFEDAKNISDNPVHPARVLLLSVENGSVENIKFEVVPYTESGRNDKAIYLYQKFTFRNCKVTETSSGITVPSALIFIRACSESIFENNEIIGFGRVFLHQALITMETSENIKIVNNKFKNADHNAILSSRSKRITIDGNYFEGIWDDCIDPNGEEDFIIVNNIVKTVPEAKTTTFVSLEPYQNIPCRKFIIANNIIFGDYITENPIQIRTAPSAEDVIIQGNIIYFSSTRPNPRIPIYISDANRVCVIGNLIRDIGGGCYGIRVYNSSNIVIEGNIFNDLYSWAAIAHIDGTINNLLVKSNILENAENNFVVRSTSPSDLVCKDVRVEGNIIRGAHYFVVQDAILDKVSIGINLTDETRWGYYVYHSRKRKVSGDGATKIFTVDHGVRVLDPARVIVTVTPISTDAFNASPVSAKLEDTDQNGIYETVKVIFATPPPSGTNNVEFAVNIMYIF